MTPKKIYSSKESLERIQSIPETAFDNTHPHDHRRECKNIIKKALGTGYATLDGKNAEQIIISIKKLTDGNDVGEDLFEALMKKSYVAEAFIIHCVNKTEGQLINTIWGSVHPTVTTRNAIKHAYKLDPQFIRNIYEGVTEKHIWEKDDIKDTLDALRFETMKRVLAREEWEQSGFIGVDEKLGVISEVMKQPIYRIFSDNNRAPMSKAIDALQFSESTWREWKNNQRQPYTAFHNLLYVAHKSALSEKTFDSLWKVYNDNQDWRWYTQYAHPHNMHHLMKRVSPEKVLDAVIFDPEFHKSKNKTEFKHWLDAMYKSGNLTPEHLQELTQYSKSVTMQEIVFPTAYQAQALDIKDVERALKVSQGAVRQGRVQKKLLQLRAACMSDLAQDMATEDDTTMEYMGL